MGRFASVVGIMRNEEKTKFPTSKLAQQLCQHVIGMRPEVLGTPDTRSKDQPEPLDENKPEAEEEVDELNAFAKVQVCIPYSASIHSSFYRVPSLMRTRLKFCARHSCLALRWLFMSISKAIPQLSRGSCVSNLEKAPKPRDMSSPPM